MKGSKPFRFKQFSVSHHRSSMKVGVDGVLVGCLANVYKANTILDIGTGCGLVALIAAQRNRKALVTGIDLHPESVEEATYNFNSSPFASRLAAINCNFLDFDESHRFDALISNPPFFDSGITYTDSARMAARHDCSLPMGELLSKSERLLSPDGVITIIFPSERIDSVKADAKAAGLFICRQTLIRGHAEAPVKRIVAELRRENNTQDSGQGTIISELSLMKKGLDPTEEYRILT